MRRICLFVVLSLAFSQVAGCSDDSKPVNRDALVNGDGTQADGSSVLGCERVASERLRCELSLPERITQDTVLAKGCYRATKTPVLSAGVKLTLSAGVTIIFAKETGLNIADKQVLAALGTQMEPICLTGDQALRGYWNGIEFSATESVDNKLDYVTVEYAGSTAADKDAAAVKAIADSRGVRLSLVHSTLKESQGFGVWLAGSAVIGEFTNNTLTRNLLGPASVDSSVASVLDAGSTFKGNDRDQIVVRAYHIDKAATWAAIDVPYYMAAGVSVSAPWTIAAGATLIMSKDSEVNVSGDAAALTAEGTVDKPIRFSGEKAERGLWGGIIFTNAGSVNNRMSYVTVEHGGSGVGQDNTANVTLTSTGFPVKLSMSHCTLRESKGYGLFINRTSALPAFDKNTITKNTKGPVHAGSEAVHQLLPSSTYTGNDVDQVAVFAAGVPGAVTWADIGVPYAIETGIVRPAKVWTLAPGVTLIMGPNAEIEVGGSNTDIPGFHAVGTAAKPILITGATKTPGAWGAIVFSNNKNAANAFDYATVEYGGGNSRDAQIVATSDSYGVKFSATHSTIRNSASAGISLSLAAITNSDLETSNTFSGNAKGNVVKK